MSTSAERSHQTAIEGLITVQARRLQVIHDSPAAVQERAEAEQAAQIAGNPQLGEMVTRLSVLDANIATVQAISRRSNGAAL